MVRYICPQCFFETNWNASDLTRGEPECPKCKDGMKQKLCVFCDGSGAIDIGFTDLSKCHNCNGRGFLHNESNMF